MKKKHNGTEKEVEIKLEDGEYEVRQLMSK